MTKGLTRTGFTEDLLIGQEAEGRVAQLLLTRGAKVEVKSDKAAHRTGNVYIEVADQGQPSGILTSETDWWVLEVMDSRYIVIRTSTLRRLTYEAGEDHSRRKAGGDNDSTLGILVPLESLLKDPGQ